MNFETLFFAKTLSGTYVNLSHVKEITIWRDHCKRLEGTDEDKYRWNLLLIIEKNDPYIWERFETKEEAQDWLDETMSEIING